MVLGKYSENSLCCSGKGGTGCQGAGNMLGDKEREMDEILDYLYSREYTESRGIRDGDLGPSQLTVPGWISKVKTLFPKETVEVLEKDALDRYGIKEIITDKDVLEKMEPNMNLLRSIMNFKHMMPGEVLVTAREIIRKVVEELSEKLKQELFPAFSGTRDRTRRSPLRITRNIDWKKTIKKNLSNYDPENKKIYLEEIFFSGFVKRKQTWHIIILIDESGSMLDSVIYSSVMAGIFASLPSVKTSLVIFDTNVVDLSEYVDDPVEILMSVQLGGGTDIARAVSYGEGLIEFPHKTLVILVTDFFEGRPEHFLLESVAKILEGGSKMICLAALDDKAEPIYNKELAKKIVNLGAQVAALTPKKLAEWVAKVINS
jgi:predicted metal-dependent peptidase